MKINRIVTTGLFAILFIYSFCFAQPRDLKSVEGKNGLVSTAHPLASQAALDILKSDGNAVDAAVAAAFTIGVVEPDGSGLGGGGCMVIYLKKENKAYFINFYHCASKEVNEIDYKRSEGINAKTALVPGAVSGLTTALEKFGTKSIKDVTKDAIKYAAIGFPIDNTLATIILDNLNVLDKYESTKKVFTPGGFPLVEGDTLKQPELASTLKTIAKKGAKGFYEGEIAEEISSGIYKEGGRITLDDLKNYHAQIEEPLYGSYRGYKIISANAPQAGATLIEAMNMMENIDFNKLGYYTESASTMHLMSEVLLRAYADRYYHLGDPNYHDIPINGFLSKEFAKARFADIDIDKTNPAGYRKTISVSPASYDYDRTNDKGSTPEDINDTESSGHTTHISVVDKDGNMVSLTQTLGTFFGCGYSVAGVLFSSGYINFSSKIEVNIVEPGKTPRSTISPTIILKDDKPFMCLGSPGGGRIISTLAEIIVNVIDFGMTAESANQAPRFHLTINEDELSMENRIPQSIRDELIKKGHTIKVFNDFDLFFGGAQFIIADPESGTYYGTADKRRGGVALGY